MPDRTYKGLANRASFIQRKLDAPISSIGPIKAPTNVQTTTITDFAPDVCKNSKQTGGAGSGTVLNFFMIEATMSRAGNSIESEKPLPKVGTGGDSRCKCQLEQVRRRCT